MMVRRNFEEIRKRRQGGDKELIEGQVNEEEVQVPSTEIDEDEVQLPSSVISGEDSRSNCNREF